MIGDCQYCETLLKTLVLNQAQEICNSAFIASLLLIVYYNFFHAVF